MYMCVHFVPCYYNELNLDRIANIPQISMNTTDESAYECYSRVNFAFGNSAMQLWQMFRDLWFITAVRLCWHETFELPSIYECICVHSCHQFGLYWHVHFIDSIFWMVNGWPENADPGDGNDPSLSPECVQYKNISLIEDKGRDHGRSIDRRRILFSWSFIDRPSLSCISCYPTYIVYLTAWAAWKQWTTCSFDSPRYATLSLQLKIMAAPISWRDEKACIFPCLVYSRNRSTSKLRTTSIWYTGNAFVRVYLIRYGFVYTEKRSHALFTIHGTCVCQSVAQRSITSKWELCHSRKSLFFPSKWSAYNQRRKSVFECIDKKSHTKIYANVGWSHGRIANTVGEKKNTTRKNV